MSPATVVAKAVFFILAFLTTASSEKADNGFNETGVSQFLGKLLHSLDRGLDCLDDSISDHNFLLALFFVKENLRGTSKYMSSSGHLSVLLTELERKTERMLYGDPENHYAWVEKVFKSPERSYRLDLDRYVKRLNMPWYQYLKRSNNLIGWTPSPRQSDKCVIELANIACGKTNGQLCPISKNCLRIIKKGSGLGYALTHRVLIMLALNKSCDCFIFGEKEDLLMKKRLCKKVYVEALYIEQHGYHAQDLFMEQITLCSFAGFHELLKPRWLMKSIEWQSQDDGCFGDSFLELQPARYHLTEVATAAISGGIKYLLEQSHNAKENEYEFLTNEDYPGNIIEN